MLLKNQTVDSIIQPPILPWNIEFNWRMERKLTEY